MEAGRWALEVTHGLDVTSPYHLPIHSGLFMRVAAFDHTEIRHTRACASNTLGGAVMSQLCKVTINGELFSANRGDLLLDAALLHGIELPYECRAGQCGTCRSPRDSWTLFSGRQRQSGRRACMSDADHFGCTNCSRETPEHNGGVGSHCRFNRCSARSCRSLHRKFTSDRLHTSRIYRFGFAASLRGITVPPHCLIGRAIRI